MYYVSARGIDERAIKVLSRQTRVCRDKTSLLSRQNYVKRNICHDKHNFVATNTCLSWQNTSVVATKIYLDTCASMIIVPALANDSRLHGPAKVRWRHRVWKAYRLTTVLGVLFVVVGGYKQQTPQLCLRGAAIAQWLESRTRDQKVMGSNPRRSGGRIFFSGVNFLCWLLFRYPFHPRVTAVARKSYIEPCFGIGHSLSLICQLTSEDIKHHFIIISRTTCERSESARERKIALYKKVINNGCNIVQELCESRGGRPNEPSGFRGRKAILNHASALVTTCP